MARKSTSTGSQSVRKRGFYSKVLDDAEQVQLHAARDIEGIDDEIALLRVKIASILEHDSDNIKLIMAATNTLARLVRTKYKLDASQSKGLKDAIGSVIKEIAIPLGIKVVSG
jgi:hypothetical protein